MIFQVLQYPDGMGARKIQPVLECVVEAGFHLQVHRNCRPGCSNTGVRAAMPKPLQTLVIVEIVLFEAFCVALSGLRFVLLQ